MLINYQRSDDFFLSFLLLLLHNVNQRSDMKLISCVDSLENYKIKWICPVCTMWVKSITLIWIDTDRFICATTLMSTYNRGGAHIFGRTGMCRSNGLLFYKKSLNTGPVFYPKILKHGSTFLTEPKFSGFRMAKIVKFLKNGPIFQKNP